MEYKHIFGPVPSRRLGISLGVDLVPEKICTLNCIYCEVGKTTLLTKKRKEYISADEIINELNDYLSNSPKLDYITITGSGEPTLNSKIGKIINHIKDNYKSYKTALITNSTLLSDKKLRIDIQNIDLILPSLDAVSCSSFKCLNRPAKGLSTKKIVKGLIKFKKIFKGEMWLEIFFSPGINDIKDELELLKKMVSKINPDRVQLNTLDRPGVIAELKPVPKEKLEEIKDYFAPYKVEIIAKYKNEDKIRGENKILSDNIISLVKRRPCTVTEISDLLGINLKELNKYLKILLDDDIIEFDKQDRGSFVVIKK